MTSQHQPPYFATPRPQLLMFLSLQIAIAVFFQVFMETKEKFEEYLTGALAILNLHVILPFGLLVPLNSPSKNRRLCYVALYCTIINFVGVILYAEHLAKWMVGGGMLCVLVVGILLSAAVQTDAPLAPRMALRHLGFNLRGYIALYTVFVFTALFLHKFKEKLSETFGRGRTMTDEAHHLWNVMILFYLESLMVYAYAVQYASEKDCLLLSFTTGLTLVAFVFHVQEHRHILFDHESKTIPCVMLGMLAVAVIAKNYEVILR